MKLGDPCRNKIQIHVNWQSRCQKRDKIAYFFETRVKIKSCAPIQKYSDSMQERMHPSPHTYRSITSTRSRQSTLSISLPLRSPDNCSHYVHHSPLPLQEVRNLSRMSLESSLRVPHSQFLRRILMSPRGDSESGSMDIRLNRNS